MRSAKSLTKGVGGVYNKNLIEELEMSSTKRTNGCLNAVDSNHVNHFLVVCRHNAS